MKTITTDKMTIGLVMVPDDAYNVILESSKACTALFFNRLKIKYDCTDNLPTGNYTFLSTTKDLTEEVAARIVDYDNDSNYKDYTLIRSTYHLRLSISSFQSLLLANGLDPSKNYAILEIKK